MKTIGGGFVTSEAKVQEINGIKTGVVEGYIASKQIEDNNWPDKFEGTNVWGDSIQEHRDRNNRPVRLNFMHRRDPIGGFPIEMVREDDRGLFGVGHINLELQKGQEVFSLARQGAISDFSIGFFIPSVSDVRFEEIGDVEVRFITKATILEGSLVDEPMNKDAQVTGVKAEDMVTISKLAEMTPRELEEILEKTGAFSRSVQRMIVSNLKDLTRPNESAVFGDVLEAVKSMHSGQAGA